MNVIILKEKLDRLANAIGIKAKRRVPQTIDELIETVDLIKTDPKLQAKTATPKKTAQTVTADTGYDGLAEVDIKATPLARRDYTVSSSGYVIIYPDTPNIGLTDVGVNVPQSNLPTSAAASYSGTLKATIGLSTSQTRYLNIPKGFINSASYYTIPKTPMATYDPPTATKGAVSNHSVTITPSHRIKSTGYIYSGNQLGTDISVSASELVSGKYTVSNSGAYDVTNYASVSVDKLTMPSAMANGGSGTKVATFSLPNGINRYLQFPKGYNDNTSYYEFDVPNGTAGTPTATKGSVSNHQVSVTPSVTNTTGYITGSTKTGTAVTVTASELVSGTKTISEPGTDIDVTNFAAVDVDIEVVNNQNKSVTPIESQQIVEADEGYTGLGEVTVGAISSSYVGSSIERRDSTDLSASGATVTAPAGYYAEAASKAVASGIAGTPTASKGAVSNHSVTVTPSVTNTTGYIVGDTKTGQGVAVTASELVSGSQTIRSNDTYDVTNLAEVVVQVENTPNLQTKTRTYTPSTSQQTETILPDSGYAGLDEVDITINAMPEGSKGMVEGTYSKTASTLQLTVSFPNMTPGYFASLSDIVIAQALENKTVTPSTSQQIITPTNTNKYLNSVTVEALDDGDEIAYGSTITR